MRFNTEAENQQRYAGFSMAELCNYGYDEKDLFTMIRTELDFKKVKEQKRLHIEKSKKNEISMTHYALTGHTSGIGKCVYDRLQPNVTAFSRSIGYNINKSEDRKKIIAESTNCDIFINNAHSGFGQVHLLIDLFMQWKDQDKRIVNVGSRIAENVLSKNKLHLLNYYSEKRSLKSTVCDLQGYNCKVEYVWFGYVGTPAILEKYPHFTSDDYITVESAADVIINACQK